MTRTASQIKPTQYVRFTDAKSFTGRTEGAVMMVHTSGSGKLVLTFHDRKQAFLDPATPVEVLGTYKRQLGGGVALV